MLSLSLGLTQTGTRSVRGMRQKLSSRSTSVRRLLQTHLIHQHYLASGGPHGAFGYPNSDVQFRVGEAMREYRGGDIHLLGTGFHDLPRLSVSIRFVGFKCVRESSWDQASPSDEPYFVITIDSGSGSPTVRKFGPFENVDTNTEMGFGDLLIDNVAPNPMSIRVIAYENDHGDPDKTAKNIQDTVVMLSQQAGAAAAGAGAEAADGPGVGPAALAAGVGGVAAGPLGALLAAGIVSTLGLGDDFINQTAFMLFEHSNDVGSPSKLGQVQHMDYNRNANVNGGDQGEYDLYFQILVKEIPPPIDH